MPHLHNMCIANIVHTFYFKNNEMPLVYRNYFGANRLIHSYVTRQAADLHKTVVNTNFGNRSIKNKAPRIWNALPATIKNIVSKYKCLKQVKAHFWTQGCL